MVTEIHRSDDCDASLTVRMPDGCVVSIDSPCGSDPVMAAIAALAAIAYAKNLEDIDDLYATSVQTVVSVVQ